jgi:hypothetical protein
MRMDFSSKYFICLVLLILCHNFSVSLLSPNTPERTLKYSGISQNTSKLSYINHYALRRLLVDPSSQPSSHPSYRPSNQPSTKPTKQPTSQPSLQPTTVPTRQPSTQPTKQPTSLPSRQPSGQPSSMPTFHSRSLGLTGGVQYLSLPPNVRWIEVDIAGAAGGSFGENRQGRGARVQTTLPVSGGSLLSIYVGGAGIIGPSSCNQQTVSGGFNGGGNGYGCGTGGGGASDIRVGGTDLSNRIIVAGGGGGIYRDCGQGGHGGQVGLDATNTATCTFGEGRGGTATAGGAGAPVGSGGTVGFPGSLGSGGASTQGGSNSGGGGAGYYGGKETEIPMLLLTLKIFFSSLFFI